MKNIFEISFSRLVLLLIAVPFVEVAVTVLMTKMLGAVITYAIFAVPTFIGIVVQWFRWKRVKPLLKTIIETSLQSEAIQHKENLLRNVEFQSKVKILALFWTSVVLLLIPGIVTDLLAFYLIFQLQQKVYNFKEL